MLAGCQESNITSPSMETDGSAKPFVSLYIENGQFSDHDSSYTFEVHAKSNVPDLYVGNTTIALYIENGFPFAALKNPDLTYISPKFTIGAPGYYKAYVAEYEDYEKKEFGLYLQILHLENHGTGNTLNMEKEKIAVIKCDVEFCVFDIVYDAENTIFLKPDYQRVLTGNYGALGGCQ